MSNKETSAHLCGSSPLHEKSNNSEQGIIGFVKGSEWVSEGSWNFVAWYTDFSSVVASIEVLQKLRLSMIRLSKLVDITS
jgi:hypothetical protein